LRELERFFLDYKVLEDKEVEVEGFQGVAEAQRALREAIEFYARQYAERRGTEPG
jgi:inorganic pyrophosphatase